MSYAEAREAYASMGVDTEAALERAAAMPVSVHCWQGDDVVGFDNPEGGAGNGIAVTGDYPGRARDFEELKADFLEAMSLVPGRKRINLHACYAIFDDEHPWVDRDGITYDNFAPWVEFARENGLGIDFNPTIFSHRMMRDGLSLSSPDPEVRRFWIDHCIACRRISERIGEELGDHVMVNVWIPDGYKDTPTDRIGPRRRLMASLDEIFAEDCPHVIDAVESKFFAVGVESYTTGSPEFYTAYSATHERVNYLLDAGHFHPNEPIAEKISSLLLFNRYVPLHVTRGVNWDSDHVVSFDDQTREICREIVRCDALDRVLVGLDFFDGSINRVAAWVIGARNFEKALLEALLEPSAELRRLQDEANFTKRLALLEEQKTMPFADVWAEYCRRAGVPADFGWYETVERYERDVTSKRG